MLLANIRLDGEPLSGDARKFLHAVMAEKGKLTSNQLIAEVERVAGSQAHNLDAMFKISPDAEEALVYDPAVAYSQNAIRTQAGIHPFWMSLTDEVKGRALGRWKKGRRVTIQWMLDQLNAAGVDASGLEKAINAELKKPAKGKQNESLHAPNCWGSISGLPPFRASALYAGSHAFGLCGSSRWQ